MLITIYSYAAEPVSITINKNDIKINQVIINELLTAKKFIELFGKPDREIIISSFGNALIYDSLGFTLRFDSSKKFNHFIIKYISCSWPFDNDCDENNYISFFPKNTFNGEIQVKNASISRSTAAKKIIKTFPSSIIYMNKTGTGCSIAYHSWQITTSMNYTYNSPYNSLNYLIFSPLKRKKIWLKIFVSKEKKSF